MRSHLDAVVRIDDLAFRANVSVGSIHRQFKRVMGTSPGECHKIGRVHEARRQIVTHAGTQSQISSRWGFVSPSQFSRDYERVFGVAPSKDFLSSRSS
ncbi:helix-turn-helix transcriptional regulator [Rhodococcus sp. (in: high G+C Gram-positive bacteria)]|uniref:helix-turn-helix transcriptional regulator n=1 Tax=Rhodococcus sp. TaxID=1831 RepID=UPI0032608625